MRRSIRSLLMRRAIIDVEIGIEVEVGGWGLCIKGNV